MSDKKYGLILAEKKKAPSFQASRNVFGNDSDSEEETSKKHFLLRPSDLTKRQAKISQEKVVLEDPTVYQYDEIYEEMVGAKEKETTKLKEEKKPRYIENLIKSANKRKIENERRMERQIQKEREEEGEEFKGKEVFVTSAYKKKLEELRQEEEKEKREEYLERIGDVTKQSDLGGFYRHLYEQKLGKDKTTESEKETIPEISASQAPITIKDKEPPAENSKKRNYRKRKSSGPKYELSEGEIGESDEEITRLNLENIRLNKQNKKTEENIDADSDFSVDDPSEEETETEPVANEKKTITKEFKTPERSVSPEIKSVTEKDDQKAKEEVVKVIEEKITIDIWKKRTVGDVFDQALKRYYERKASRGI